MYDEFYNMNHDINHYWINHCCYELFNPRPVTASENQYQICPYNSLRNNGCHTPDISHLCHYNDAIGRYPNYPLLCQAWLIEYRFLAYFLFFNFMPLLMPHCLLILTGFQSKIAKHVSLRKVWNVEEEEIEHFKVKCRMTRCQENEAFPTYLSFI